MVKLFERAARMTINWRENFVEVWDQIKRQGEQEGFKDKELQEMFRPYLVKDGLSTNQIRYLFNAEEYKDRSKEQHTRNKSANIPQIDVKKDTEQKDIEKIGEIRRAEEKRETLQGFPIPTKTEYVDPEKEEEDDIEFLKSRLAKYVDDLRLRDVLVEHKDEQILQLQEALKKTSFEPATEYKPGPPLAFQWPEPDESNTFVWKETTFDELRRALGPLKAGGNTKINVYLERVR